MEAVCMVGKQGRRIQVTRDPFQHKQLHTPKQAAKKNELLWPCTSWAVHNWSRSALGYSSKIHSGQDARTVSLPTHAEYMAGAITPSHSLHPPDLIPGICRPTHWCPSLRSQLQTDSKANLLPPTSVSPWWRLPTGVSGGSEGVTTDSRGLLYWKEALKWGHC